MRTARAGSAATWRWLLAGAVAVQLVVLYWPSPGDTPGADGLDKVVHALVFAAVAVTGRYAGVPVRWLAVLLLGHAVLSELVQHTLLPERSGDVADTVADVVGTVVGLLVPLPRRASRTHTGRAP